MSQFDTPQEIEVGSAPTEGETVTFKFTDQAGMESDGFVVRFGGKLYAYKNQCRHQPLPLDYGDGDFMDNEGRYLLCRNHAALFEPDSGQCVSGPCTGAALFNYPVEERGGNAVVTIPYVPIDLE